MISVVKSVSVIQKKEDNNNNNNNNNNNIKESTVPVRKRKRETYNLGQKVLRILLFPTHRRPTLRIWHHGDPSPHPSLVNVV